jgi:hypothetical protein
MTTPNLREKINQLNQWLMQADLEKFALELQIQMTEVSTGDAQVDQQLAGQAQNAKAAMLGVDRRIAVYQAALDPLQAELAPTAK